MCKESSYRWLTALACATLAGCAEPHANGRPEGAGSPTALIPRKVLFGNPDRAAPRLSPDGTKLAFLAVRDGVMNVWVGPADKPGEAQPVTQETQRGIRTYSWAYTSQHVLYLQDNGGDENWRVHCVDLTSGVAKPLTSNEPIKGPNGEPQKGPDGKPLIPSARLQRLSPKFPAQVLVAINDRDPRLHDLYKVNLEDGTRELVQENQGFLAFVTDDEFAARFALRMTPDGGQEMLKPAGGGGWTLFQKIEPADMLTTAPVDFDKTGQVLYMVDSRGRNTGALTAIDLSTEKQTVLASDSRADAGDYLIHPTEKTIQAVSFTYDRQRWEALDPATKADLSYLGTVCPGDLQVNSRTQDDRWWIVAYVQDNGPVRYYRYDRTARRAEFLFTNRKALEGETLARMHPVIVKARDGLELVCYFSLPPWTDADGDGRPTELLPMVLLVHGGPWARDGWGYNGMHQWLANRGYAVLSVNFRGSTGFGKSFINAADKEWGGKMHDDLIDAMEWAVRSGIADRRRVAIMGGSYGGYATLVGLTFTPDLFACGVDIVGPSNLNTLLRSIPEYWKPMLDLFCTRVGDHRTPEGEKFLNACSPLTYVDRIRRPLLIGQGANDPRVKQAESDQIVSAMKQRGIPVTYVLFPDEGHGFARPANSISFNAVAEAFLARHLGGRYEPIGSDFAGSTIQVPEGAAEVPGLAEALPKS